MRYLLSLLAFALLVAPPLSGQTAISVSSPADERAARILLEIVERGDYTLLEGETVLPRDQVIPGDLIIIEARVALEGRVTGSVAVVNADFFVRPGAVVDGQIAILGITGAFPSGLSQVGEIVELTPGRSVMVTRSPDGVLVTVHFPPPPGLIRLNGLYGLGVPTYDRVNGLSLLWGATLAPGETDSTTFALSGTVAYQAARERLDGRLEATYRTGRRSLLSAWAARGSRTTDVWIRGDLANSASSLGVRSDVRDYFESEEVGVALYRLPPSLLVEGEAFIAPQIAVRLARDRSLPASDPWSMFQTDEEWRENPPIDEGVIASITVGATGAWRGVSSNSSGQLGVEWAPGVAGDFEFAQVSAMGAYAMEALWGHRVRIDGFALLSLGQEAPLQRWSFLGGPGTLPAEPIADMRGDRVLFLRSTYIAPVQWASLPIVGVPALRIDHLVGAAWRTGTPTPTLEQNVGAGLQINLLYAMWYTNPAERDRDFEVSLGVTIEAGRVLPIF